MTIYKIDDIKDYSKLINEMFTKGSLNMMEEVVPLFSEHQEMFNFFEIENKLIDEIYDDDGLPLWQYKKERLPIRWLTKLLTKRVDNMKFRYPFYVVVAGHSGWDRMGNMESKTFYEVQTLETP